MSKYQYTYRVTYTETVVASDDDEAFDGVAALHPGHCDIERIDTQEMEKEVYDD